MKRTKFWIATEDCFPKCCPCSYCRHNPLNRIPAPAVGTYVYSPACEKCSRQKGDTGDFKDLHAPLAGIQEDPECPDIYIRRGKRLEKRA